MLRTTAFLAGLLAAAPAAFAQAENGLTPEDAQAFLDQVGEQAGQAAETGDWNGIAAWMSDHVAPDAPIQIAGEYVMSAGPTGTFRLSLSGEELVGLSRMTAMGMSNGMMGDMLQDFRMQVRTGDSWQVPGGLVGVTVTFYETGMIGAEHGGESFGGAFSSMTECALHLGRSADDVVIRAATCDVASMF